MIEMIREKCFGCACMRRGIVYGRTFSHAENKRAIVRYI
jgi:hypothetical protein